jgi:hypothetical protein
VTFHRFNFLELTLSSVGHIFSSVFFPLEGQGRQFELRDKMIQAFPERLLADTASLGEVGRTIGAGGQVKTQRKLHCARGHSQLSLSALMGLVRVKDVESVFKVMDDLFVSFLLFLVVAVGFHLWFLVVKSKS